MHLYPTHQSSFAESLPYVFFAVLMVTLDVTIKIRSTKKQTLRPMVDPVSDKSCGLACMNSKKGSVWFIRMINNSRVKRWLGVENLWTRRRGRECQGFMFGSQWLVPCVDEYRTLK